MSDPNPKIVVQEDLPTGSPSLRGVLLVLFLSFVVYLPSVGSGFVLDDDPIVNSMCVTRVGEPDPMITAHWDAGVFAYLGKFFTRPYWWPETYNDGLYRPISVLSYGLVYQLCSRPFLSSEFESMPQHAVNVILHLWAVWLVMSMLTRVGASGFVSLLTGLLFGVHAIHSEVVAGIVGRAEILSFCFGAQAMLLLNRGGWWRYLLGGVCMYLAYGSKESSFAWLVFFFCFQLTQGWIKHPEQPWHRGLTGSGVLFASFAMILPIALWAGLRSVAMDFDPPMTEAADWSSNPLGHVADSTRILTAVKVWGFASWLCVLPYPLSCLYSPDVFQLLESPWDLGFLVSLFWLLGFLGVGLWWGRRLPLLFFAMTCFLGFSFVTSNVPMGIGTIFGERLYYTPSLGICLLPGLIWPLLRKRGQWAFLLVVSTWCAGSMVMAIHRTLQWKDNATLFVADVETYPMSIDLHRKCASVYRSDGPHKDLDKAIDHLEEAKRIMPTYVHAFRELGKIYLERREWDTAIGELKQALAVGRDYGDPPGAESIAYALIGNCKLGKAVDTAEVEEKRRLLGEAQSWFSKSLQVPPWGDAYGESYNKIGDCVIALSELETDESAQRRLVSQALAYYRKTIDMGKQQQQSHRVAFRRLFQYVVLFSSPLLTKRELVELYMSAKQCAGEDYQLTLLMGAMAYKANLSTQMVFEPLRWAIENYPEDKKDLEFYKAHLFYADVLGELGDRAGATRVFKMLLARPDFPDEYKKQIRTKHGLR